MLKRFFKSCRYGNCLKIIERQFSDMFKVILFEKAKGKMIHFMLRGILGRDYEQVWQIRDGVRL